MVKIMKKMNLFGASLLALTFAFSVNAKEVDTNIGVVQAMDKITGRVSTIEIPVGGEVSFADFDIKLKSCKTTPPEEAPENFAFINIIENLKDDKVDEVFNGWMVSSSPALHEVQHPVYDVWLIKCIDGDLSKFDKKEDLIEETSDVSKRVVPEKVNSVKQIKGDVKLETKPIKKDIKIEKEVKVIEDKVEVKTPSVVETVKLKNPVQKLEEQVIYKGSNSAKDDVVIEVVDEVVYKAPEKIEVIAKSVENDKASEIVYGIKKDKAD